MGVVGVGIAVARIEGTWKMSQNRREADGHGVAAGARADGEDAFADLAAARGARSELVR